MPGKLKSAVLGASGYSGLELTRLLERHPRLEKPLLFRRENGSDSATDLTELFPELSGNGGYPLRPLSWPELKRQGVQLLFLATPHDASRSLVPEAIAQGLRVIDLSGAWRLKQAEHRAIYRFEDADAATAAELTAKAVYGLPELNGDRIAAANTSSTNVKVSLLYASWSPGAAVRISSVISAWSIAIRPWPSIASLTLAVRAADPYHAYRSKEQTMSGNEKIL